MKKNLLIVLLFLFIMFQANIKCTRAIEKFPDTIYVKPSSLMGKYGFHLYKKTFSYTQGGEDAGKDFCTSFWNPEPGECDVGRSTCTKAKWCKDKTKNTRVSIAVGSIIYSARNSKGSMSWDNYFYTELAINRYISNVGCGGSANKFSAPQQIENVIKKYVVAAEKAYKEYNSNTVIIENLKINSTNSKGNNVVGLTKENSYSLSATMTCKGADGKKTACSTIETGLNVKIGNTELKPKVTYKKKSDKTVTLTADVSKIINNNPGKEITFSITGYNKIKYYQAQRYSCGKSCGSVAQTMSPNALKPVVTSKKASATGVFKAPNKVLVPNPETNIDENTCSEKLEELQDGNGAISDEKALIDLYNEEKAKGNEVSGLLNLDSPSCGPISNSSDISCGTSTVVKRTVESKIIDGKNYNMYCQLSYSFDSDILKDTFGTPNNLIYKSDDGIIGQANVTYDCYVLNMGYSDKQKSSQFNINLKELIPSVSIKIFNKEINFGYDIDIETFKSINPKCSVDGDMNITCDNYLNNRYGWAITFDVDYHYNNGNKWSVQKGNLTGSKQTTVINSDSCVNNCLEYGYGVYVPVNIAVDEGNADFKVDLKDTKFNEGFESSNDATSNCSYEIQKEKTKSEVIYRGIDTSNPFLNYEGNKRYVGNNWCGSELIDEDFDYQDNLLINEQLQCKKRYLGDVNDNNEWDVGDVELIQKASLNLIVLDAIDKQYADVNEDERITAVDASIVSDYIYRYNTSSKGDINFDGVVDLMDASLTQLSHVGYIKLSEVQKNLGDINCDGQVNVIDSSEIKKIFYNLNSAEETENNDDNNIEDIEDKELNDSENIVSRTEEGYYCSANNITVKKYITDRPNSSGLIKITKEGVTTTSKVEPLYSFTLTPSTLKKIRKYNDSNSYNDFTLECKEGKKCVSTFITNLANEEYGNTFANGKCSNRSSFCEVVK